MRTLDPRTIGSGKGCTRRDLLRAGSAGMLSAGVPRAVLAATREALQPSCERSVILLMLVGGPGHLDTFDPKPDAPAEIRGPFRAIRTSVPGILLSEILPRTARHADKFAILRAMHHDAPAVHDSGHQLLQTGRLASGDLEHPHVGCVLDRLRGPREGIPAHVLLPCPIGATGGNLSHGQSAGRLGPRHDPVVTDPDRPDLIVRGSVLDVFAERQSLREAYGDSAFGRSCLAARRLVQRGVRCVTVNMFDTVFRTPTWDAHGSAPFPALSCYRDTVGPMFDAAYSALLEDLHNRGLLESTLVVAAGEFGRTPRINPAGGRDHWTRCWSILLAGGGVRGGQVIGASDATGSEPRNRPTTPAEVVATIYRCLGMNPATTLPGPDGTRLPLVDPGVRPIAELF